MTRTWKLFLIGLFAVTQPLSVQSKETGKLAVFSVPRGAQIAVNGTATGKTTPSILVLPAGKVTVTVKMVGYKEWNEEVQVLGGVLKKIKASLISLVSKVKLDPAKLLRLQDLAKGKPEGKLSVLVLEPEECFIFLDGKRLVKEDGTPYLTPVEIPKIPGGTYTVTVAKRGYRDLVSANYTLDGKSTPIEGKLPLGTSAILKAAKGTVTVGQLKKHEEAFRTRLADILKTKKPELFMKLAGLDTPRLKQLVCDNTLDELYKKKIEKGMDIYIVFDSTDSMADCIGDIKRSIEAIVKKVNSKVVNARFGLITYQDYTDAKVVRGVPLGTGIRNLKAWLSGIEAGGGGDHPEAVFSGLDAAISKGNWKKGNIHTIILIGDAPPHFNELNKVKKLITRFHKENGKVHVIDSAVDPIHELEQIAKTGGGDYLRLASVRKLSFLIVSQIFKSARVQPVRNVEGKIPKDPIKADPPKKEILVFKSDRDYLRLLKTVHKKKSDDVFSIRERRKKLIGQQFKITFKPCSKTKKKGAAKFVFGMSTYSFDGGYFPVKLCIVGRYLDQKSLYTKLAPLNGMGTELRWSVAEEKAKSIYDDFKKLTIQVEYEITSIPDIDKPRYFNTKITQLEFYKGKERLGTGKAMLEFRKRSWKKIP